MGLQRGGAFRKARKWLGFVGVSAKRKKLGGVWRESGTVYGLRVSAGARHWQNPPETFRQGILPMIVSIKKIALALVAANCLFAAAAQAQTFQSSSWNSRSSSSSSSRWGVNPDGTTFRTGDSRSDSQFQATNTTGRRTPLGVNSNTTTLNQQRSTRNGFAHSNGPGGVHQSVYSDDSGSLSLTNQRRHNGVLGSTSDTRSLNAQFRNQNSVSQGIGPGGIYNQRLQRNTGNVTLGRNVRANSLFGPSVHAGSTRTAGFENVQSHRGGLNSGGVFQDRFNRQTITNGGSNFLRFRP